MRSTAILAAIAAVSLVASPVVYAQTSTTTETVKTDTNAVWQKIKGSWNTAKGAVKEQGQACAIRN